MMPSDYVVTADYQGRLKAQAASGDLSLTLDYPKGRGSFTPLELFLVSLAGCSVTSFGFCLNKARVKFENLRVEAKAQRRDEHPTLFTAIDLHFTLKADPKDAPAIDQALKTSEGQVCPVYAMVKPGVPIQTTVRIEK